jgi:hypothetical protein
VLMSETTYMYGLDGPRVPKDLEFAVPTHVSEWLTGLANRIKVSYWSVNRSYQIYLDIGKWNKRETHLEFV